MTRAQQPPASALPEGRVEEYTAWVSKQEDRSVAAIVKWMTLAFLDGKLTERAAACPGGPAGAHPLISRLLSPVNFPPGRHAGNTRADANVGQLHKPNVKEAPSWSQQQRSAGSA